MSTERHNPAWQLAFFINPNESIHWWARQNYSVNWSYNLKDLTEFILHLLSLVDQGLECEIRLGGRKQLLIARKKSAIHLNTEPSSVLGGLAAFGNDPWDDPPPVVYDNRFLSRRSKI